jgi:hypothetical protein
MKTKVLLAAFCLSGVLYACSNNQEEEKKQLDEILTVHDKVMGESEQAMKNKMILDSLVRKSSDTSKTNKPAALSNQLKKADEAMEDWMHKFNPDYTGKSHDEVMKYLHSQHAQLLQVDSMLTTAINQSNNYLSTAK